MYALRVQIESRSAKAWFCLRDFIFGNNSFSLALLDSSLVKGAKEDFVIPLPPSLREVPRARKAGVWRKELPYFSLPCVRGEQALSCLSGLPQRFCAAKALWDNFRAPAKIAWRVLWEEERQAYQVMRQTKRAADPNALPRRGVALTTCELGNAPLFGAFPDRGGVSLAPPRRWLAEGKTEGLLN